MPKSLHKAADKGDLRMLLELLEQGHDVNAQDKSGRTPLRLAREYEELAREYGEYEAQEEPYLIELLIKAGAKE